MAMVRWAVTDGLQGPRQVHTTEVPDDELAECEGVEERAELINLYIKDDFKRLVDYVILGYGDGDRPRGG